MSHLSLETIARLVDEQPSALDNAHLASCAACRAELDAMRADIAALSDLPDMEPSAAAWSAIEARLEAEGLLHKRMHIAPAHTRSFTMLARAAAIAAIFFGGALVGRAMRSAPVGAPAPTNVAQNETPAPGAASNATSTEAAAQTAPAPSVEAPAQGPVRMASSGAAQNTNSTRGTASRGNASAAEEGDAALRALRAAEDRYFSALSKYSEKAGTTTNDPTARLAALEGIVLTTRAALAQSPTDPVINGYHLTALAQRDAMLKQIRATPATSW